MANLIAGRGRNEHPEPHGCRWCGLPNLDHMQRWKPPVGWHKWEPPTQEQIKERMLVLRAECRTTQNSN